MISINIDSREVNEALARIIRATKDQSRPLKQSAIVMLKSVLTNFRVGGRPKWKPLAASTVRNRRRGSSRPLLDTGRHIRDTITMQVTSTEARVGPGHGPIPRIHQFGGTINLPEIRPKRASMSEAELKSKSNANAPRALRWFNAQGQAVFARRVRAHSVTIPARPYLVFHPEDIRTIISIFEKHNYGS
jgi:phage gpG-like protein